MRGTPDRLSFGIKTTPENVSYDELVRLWRDADAIPEIEHAWLFDHLLPLWSDPSADIFEGWTLLAALAAQTERVRLGLIVTNNRLRLPSMLAKVAATVDVISNGRLDFGIGVGGRPRGVDRTEYEASGVTEGRWSDAVAGLDEACAIVRRLWTEDVVDFDGDRYRLVGGRSNPKPIQRPHPPMMIGGTGSSTLRVTARHADIWNAVGPPLHSVDQLVERSGELDRLCAEVGRDPREIMRSVQVPVSGEAVDETRRLLSELASLGFHHLVLSYRAPYRRDLARWSADELISPVL